MELSITVVFMIVGAFHHTSAFDRQYSVWSGQACGVPCRPGPPAPRPLPSVRLSVPAVLPPPDLSAAAGSADERTEPAAGGDPVTSGRPEATAGVETKRSPAAQYTHYPARFQSEQYKVCQPSSGQIVQFLRALHAARRGEPNQLATLCGTTRPVDGIQTNMRFFR
ncbi:hypothetical protein FJT64_001251 [Amphibalanus amphitrite]|uniref:Uncharacterized protein n=1 Tax=Amphibalanus amphitrite TaxID=1232801 RepID=A0A6A4VH42_AMPAM|nr:hypothetical protein FJT64_001251 [Amphibalanus amphitrite]